MRCNWFTLSIVTNRIKSWVNCIIHSCDPPIVIDRQEHKGRGFHDFCGDTRVNRFQESPMSRLDHEAERNSFSSLVTHEYVPETRNRHASSSLLSTSGALVIVITSGCYPTERSDVCNLILIFFILNLYWYWLCSTKFYF